MTIFRKESGQSLAVRQFSGNCYCPASDNILATFPQLLTAWEYQWGAPYSDSSVIITDTIFALLTIFHKIGILQFFILRKTFSNPRTLLKILFYLYFINWTGQFSKWTEIEIQRILLGEDGKIFLEFCQFKSQQTILQQ